MQEAEIHRLIFVYNANSGIGNALLDSAHKIISPDTYSCRLCDLTFGISGERAAWKKYRKEQDIAMEFLHRNEFIKKYASKFIPQFTFPIVLAETLNGLQVLIGTAELSAMRTLEQLTEVLCARTKS